MEHSSPDGGDLPARSEPTAHYMHVVPVGAARTLSLDDGEARRYKPRRFGWRCGHPGCRVSGTTRGEWAALEAVVAHAGKCRR